MQEWPSGGEGRCTCVTSDLRVRAYVSARSLLSHSDLWKAYAEAGASPGREVRVGTSGFAVGTCVSFRYVLKPPLTWAGNGYFQKWYV